MIKSACNIMKKSVMLSAVFIVVGTILEIITQFLTFETIVPAIFTYGGLLIISLGIVIILVTAVAVMIPKVNRTLDICQH